MKTTMPILLTMALTTAGFTKATAGDREWATAGKVLTGVFAGAVIARALDSCPPVYTAPACTPTRVVYQPAPVIYQPAPVVYQPAPVVYQPAPVVYQPAPVIPPVAIVPPAPTVVVYQQPACSPVYVRPVPMMHRRVPVFVAPPVVGVHFQFGGPHRGHGRW